MSFAYSDIICRDINRLMGEDLSSRPVHPDLGSIEGAVRIELPIDDDWRRACRARLAELGITQAELRDYTGASQAGISQALSHELAQATSIHAHAISLALKVPLSDKGRIHLLTHQADDDKKLMAYYLRMMEEARALRQG